MDHARTISAAPAFGGVLGKRLEGKRVCICAGSGGVGKTTVSAALALGLAGQGKRVVVVTIDPARRLAGALGIAAGGGAHRAHGSGGAAVRAPVRLAPRAGRRGELWALTLDVAATFDELLAELAPDEETRVAIRENNIYRELSSAVAGSHEIAAVAKLFELVRDGAFDVIVLDTPPASNALDFLDAPTRMAGFLEGRAMNMFLAAGSMAGGRGADGSGGANGGASARATGRGRLLPAVSLGRVVPRSVAARLLGGSTAMLLSLFARATGVEVVGELAVFFRLLSGMSDGLRERSRAVEALLRDAATTFLIVTSPEHEAAREAEFLRRHLEELAMPYGALVVNRVHDGAIAAAGEAGDGEGSAAELEAQLATAVGPRLTARLLRNLADVEVLVRRDRECIAELARAIGEPEPVCVAQLGADIDSIAGLEAVAARLLG